MPPCLHLLPGENAQDWENLSEGQRADQVRDLLSFQSKPYTGKISHSGPPIYKLFFSSEKIKLGDISGSHSHDFCHLHMIYSCPGNDQRKPGSQQRCHVSRAIRKVREELFPCSGAATPRSEGIRRTNDRAVHFLVHSSTYSSIALY